VLPPCLLTIGTRETPAQKNGSLRESESESKSARAVKIKRATQAVVSGTPGRDKTWEHFFWGFLHVLAATSRHPTE
jgi:hypothetical protein